MKSLIILGLGISLTLLSISSSHARVEGSEAEEARYESSEAQEA